MHADKVTIVAGALFVVLFTVLTRGLLAQEPVYTLRVDVPVVSVDVGVSDLDGKPVTTLSKDDFVLYQDGVRQEIQNFSPVESPYHIVLLVDLSGSTRGQRPLIVQAVNRFFKSVRPQDMIALATFDSIVERLMPFRSVWVGSRQVITLRRPSTGGTDFYRAVEWAARELRNVNGRKGAVVLTDGIHEGIPTKMVRVAGERVQQYISPEEDREFQRILRTVWQSRAPFYFVAVSPSPRTLSRLPGAASPGPPRMQALAEISGGRVVFPKTPEDVIPLYERIARDLGTAYSLGYTPASPENDGRYRRIEVQVRDRNYRVSQSRDGYYAK